MIDEKATFLNFYFQTNKSKCCFIGRDLIDDVKRRLPHYVSDYKDGVIGHKTPKKTAATVVFLYFSCLLPSIAFGVLNAANTENKIGSFFIYDKLPLRIYTKYCI